MNTRYRQSCWIVTLSLAAMAVVYLTFAWLPCHREIRRMCQQVDAMRTSVAEATGLSAGLICVQQELDGARAVVRQWEEAAPGEREISGLFGKINGLAKDARLAIARFDPQPAAVHQRLREIPVAMTCSGTFDHIYEFLRSVEGLPATIWVESMRIEKMARDAKDVQCELNLVVFSK